MFERNGFSRRANAAVRHSIALAASLGHTYIGTEHLLLGILKEGSGPAFHVLAQHGVTLQPFHIQLLKVMERGEPSQLTEEDFTPRCRRALENAIALAQALDRPQVDTEELLTAVLRMGDSRAVQLLRDMGAAPELLLPLLGTQPCAEPLPETPAEKARRGQPQRPVRTAPRTALLERYSRDLTEQARLGRLDPVIGREKEIARVVQILSRRTKNNPCIIGEAGVGKTAIAEGLAACLAEGRVPGPLKHMRLLSLDLSGMVAGTKYRGDFEERIKGIVDEVCAAGNIVLFIDEIHNLIGTGAAEGAVDAANILKPQLARGEFQVVGATTAAEYRRYIEKDAALERRFQSVEVAEPDEATAVEILKGLRKRYETHHELTITDEAIAAAVALSARYLPDRRLPDKAIDLIDEAASRMRLNNADLPAGITALEQRVAIAQREKDAAVCSQNFELAAALRDACQTLQAQLQQARSQWRSRVSRGMLRLGAEDIALLVADITGIDTAVVTEDQSRRLLQLEELLHRDVVGQDEAVSAVARAIRRSRMGLRDPRRPIGSFLFLGPTGVGKTQLCRALSRRLFGDEKALIRLDMTEYMEPGSVARLIGPPPGYVGYDQGSHALERVRGRPYSVVLFDEIEKAHPDVCGLLLQAIDNGMVTDAQGRGISFRNAVIIMTSNLGCQRITEGRDLGFGAGGAGRAEEETRREVLQEVRRSFRPEFLNRIDETVVFRRLGREQVRQIALQLLDEVKALLAQKGVDASFDPQVAEALARQGYDPAYGARPLRRALQSMVEDPLSEALLEGRLKRGDRVLCGYGTALTLQTGAVLAPATFSSGGS